MTESGEARGTAATPRDDDRFLRPQSLGELLVRERLLTKQRLAEALDLQRQEPEPRRPFGQLLVERGIVTARQLDYVLDKYRKRGRVGEILVRAGLITPEQVAIALERQKTEQIPLGLALLRLGYISELDLRQALCTQRNVAFVDLDSMVVDPALGQLVSKGYARRHLIVPIARMGQTLTVALDDPTDTHVIEELHSATGLTVRVVTALRASLERAFARVYEEQPEAVPGTRLELVQDLPERDKSQAVEEFASQKADDLVRSLLGAALDRGASDLHLEALESRLQVRLRVDGVLHSLNMPQLQQVLDQNRHRVVSRIKILAALDIAERRRPQDGSFRARVVRAVERPRLDFRVSIIPSYYGESVVVRVLDPRNAPSSVQNIAFSRRLTEALTGLLQRTTGVLLITGPTGSGKSTTLYGCLMSVYRPAIRILTAEDPIEYVYDQLSQCEVNERLGNTFAAYIRAFLRHDPEVIMVGEIRDGETAEMALRVAQTGHLLLSTLHTNDAVGAVPRLLDLGVDRNLLASSLMGVIAQRLVRRICRHCRTEAQPSPGLLSEFYETAPTDITFRRGTGCVECNFTGYRGRMPVAELWMPSQDDILLITKGAPLEELRASATGSTISMAEDMAEKLRAGDVDLDELIRTMPYSAVLDHRRLESQPRQEPPPAGALRVLVV